MKKFFAVFIIIIPVILISCKEKSGCIEGDCEEGKGVYKLVDESLGEIILFKGDFVGGKIYFGEAEYTSAKWNYTGELDNWKPHGNGVLIQQESRYRYEGRFENGNIVYGKEIFMVDGTTYEGEFHDYHSGITSKGKKTFSNGDSYDGEFLHNYFHGKGIFIKAEDKTVYDGSWVEGKKEGEGKLTLAKGDIIEGIWAADTLQKQIAYLPKEKSLSGSVSSGGFCAKLKKLISEAPSNFEGFKGRKNEEDKWIYWDCKSSLPGALSCRINNAIISKDFIEFYYYKGNNSSEANNTVVELRKMVGNCLVATHVEENSSVSNTITYSFVRKGEPSDSDFDPADFSKEGVRISMRMVKGQHEVILEVE